jgi:hypothetical protein
MRNFLTVSPKPIFFDSRIFLLTFSGNVTNYDIRTKPRRLGMMPGSFMPGWSRLPHR